MGPLRSVRRMYEQLVLVCFGDFRSLLSGFLTVGPRRPLTNRTKTLGTNMLPDFGVLYKCVMQVEFCRHGMTKATGSIG